MPRHNERKSSKHPKYPHFKATEIAHKHPRTIEVNVLMRGEKKTLRQSFTMDSQAESTITPTKRNPNLITQHVGQFHFKHYKNGKQVFIYDMHEKYCGKMEKHDLKRLFFLNGGWLKEFKKWRQQFDCEKPK